MKYTIGIGVLIDTPDFNHIRTLELALANKIGSFAGLGQPPHVTVKRPFDVEGTEAIEKCQQLMSELADKTQPFEMTLEGIRHFGESVLYFKVEQNQSLQTIHSNLIDTIEPLFPNAKGTFESDKIVFHSTLAMGLSAFQFNGGQELLNTYNPDQLSLTTIVRRIGLFLGIDNNSHWTVISEKNLAQTATD